MKVKLASGADVSSFLQNVADRLKSQDAEITRLKSENEGYKTKEAAAKHADLVEKTIIQAQAAGVFIEGSRKALLSKSPEELQILHDSYSGIPAEDHGLLKTAGAGSDRRRPAGGESSLDVLLDEIGDDLDLEDPMNY